VKRFFLLLVFLSGLASAQERVLDFHSEIRIAPSGELTVKELIRVQVEGRDIRRGILRDFPTEYRDRSGARVRVPFEVVSVLRNGRPEPYALEQLDNGVRIRIGDANVLLPRGPQLYQVIYRTARQIGFFEAHDELYWNVNGNGWTFRFDRLSAEVRLPARVAAEALKLEAYTGPQGARGSDYQAAPREDGAVFRATRALAPSEGMTIVVAFPKGIVTPPPASERARFWIADRAGLLAGMAGFGLLFGFLFWRWWTVGRDPRRGPRFPRYEAPPGLGPAGVRYVDRMNYDDRCVAAALLGLGQRGYLKIRQAGERWELQRTGRDVAFLPGEQALTALLFDAGERVTVERKHDARVQAARDAFRRALDNTFSKENLFHRNRGSLYGGIAFAVATFAAMAALEAPDYALFTGVVLMAATLLAFEKWLPAYSVRGRMLQDQIEGLRQYLGVAEKDDLARMKEAPQAAPPVTPQEFSRFLPYAVALDVEKTWADRFAAALGMAAVAAAVADYYVSDSGGELFGGASFASGVGDMGAAISAAATPPGSSSGADGGGSSGGGGGGGGGSGW
jgi:hypothetical protein